MSLRTSARTWTGLLGTLIVGALAACGGDSTGPTGLQPEALSIAPDSGTVGTRVAIAGSSFEAGATVGFDGVRSDSVVLVDASTLLAFAPDGLTAGNLYDVSVANPGGKHSTLTGAFKAVEPALLVVNGVSRPSGNTGSTVILEGKSFGDLASFGHVYFSDDTGQPVEATISRPENWTDEFVVTTVPSSAADGPVWIETATGVSDSIPFRILQSASFSPSLIQWTATTSLPEGLQGLGAVFLSIEDGPGAGQLVFVTGGADGSVAPKSAVRYAEVDATGSFSAWTDGQSLPAARAFHAAALATPFNAFVDTLDAGHMYVIGGIDDTGSPTTTVYHSTVGLDRTNPVWTEETPLPVPLHSAGAAVFRSWLYVIGGATAGDVPVADVYRAHIEEDGSLGPWEAQPSLPQARAYPAVALSAGVLYVLGGETAAVAPGDATLTSTRLSSVVYNPLDLRTAELSQSSWSLNPSSMGKDRAKHTSVAAGGYVLVSGGLYNGAATSSSEHSYAAVAQDGTLGSFNGATGSQTIVSAGGVPFFNHAALGYVDAAGEAHVVILGGADVSAPTTALDGVWIY